MPRVTQPYRDARRRQIVSAARRCFTRSGFHATSMQDIFAESGLSAGAVYGYFASKEALVEAIVTDVLAEITTGFDAVLADDAPPRPGDVLQHVFEVLEQQEGGRDFACLAVQVWAEALRNPALRALLADAYEQVRVKFLRLVERGRQAGSLDPAVPAEDVARALTALGPAFLFQRALLDSADARVFHSGLSAVLSARSPAPVGGDQPAAS
ncbi:TetR/AcrR family transcriptional regulator [Actinokineospora iranica]|uniref:DNA-binding transcriptional regulator, AcrR family n=1 Tax=Actinokineospora iranica TaxID=1271860 RepID=A0A1G6YCA7_9PSEU|nr:TetR/AcrR family transcriptional regulator [Actinokineospora iranica]SDD87970.1 DNA-binding transcriptional regulator, AcrR family [Actinokineospora iranica]